MAKRKSGKTATSNGANLGFEAKLWLAADKLRSKIDAAEYKHVVLGLINLAIRGIEGDLVDCMVALPCQLFYSTQIPVCFWFLARNKSGVGFQPAKGNKNRKQDAYATRDRRGETLFTDARKLGTMIHRVHRDLTDKDIARIAETYHAWRGDRVTGVLPVTKDEEDAALWWFGDLGFSVQHGPNIAPGEAAFERDSFGDVVLTTAVTDLSRAFALCAAHDEAIRIRDDIAFFQAVKAAIVKPSGEQKPQEDLDQAVRQLVSKAITAGDEIIDVFSAAGLKKPDISILSNEFLAEVRRLKHKNVAAELLEKLLKNEIKTQSRRNVVQARAFSEMLKQALNKYHNRAIAMQEIIDELLNLAKEMREANQRGEDLGLNDDEICFYDALAQNESAVQAMGIDELKVIAAELVTKVRESVTIDWTVRESVRVKIRVMVRRILRKHGYPPDRQAEPIKLVLEQAEALCEGWAC